MPCFKCSNGKWKYGKRGRCQFDTLSKCRAAEAVIHAGGKKSLNEDCAECSDPISGTEVDSVILDDLDLD